jgi:hypothetical protein
MTAVHFGGGGRPSVPPPAIIGNKGYGLLRLVEAGLPVPPGFVLGTEWCHRFHECGDRLPPELEPVLDSSIRELERVTGCRLGDRRRPLLVSVRSGAAASMPGMMDTVLNLGLNDNSVRGLIEKKEGRRERRAEVDPDPAILAEVFPAGAPPDFRCYAGPGCDRCGGSGYKGRRRSASGSP